MKKPNYGIDAPPVIKQLILMGIISLIVGTIVYILLIKFYYTAAIFLFTLAIIYAAICFTFTLLMFWSSLYGKLRMRDKLIDSLNLKSDEKVLDVGCGRGLLLIGAAKKLNKNGKAVGIDLWRNEDLSDNRKELTLENANLEKVLDCIDVVSGDMTKMEFADNSFDAVISSMAIHNIPNKEGRNQAICEMTRVLKSGGKIAIIDFQCTEEYKKSLLNLGWRNVNLSKRIFWIFPPVRMLMAEKRMTELV